MAESLSGTVTFLFTDIVDSTRLWEEHPAAMTAALARHDRLLGEVMDAHFGRVFSRSGDGLAVVFGRAGDAVRGAVAAQLALSAESWPEPVELRVRMGLHTGEADERGDDYFGPAVNRAARLMSSADGGHVVVSLSTAEIVRVGLRDGLDLVDVGTRDLKGISRPERVFEVTWPGGPAPVLPSGRAMAGGALPREARTLVGRDPELEVLCGVLGSRPLVTLTGVGGAGKTALAVAAAQRVAHRYRDGVWFVDLSAILSGAEVPGAIADLLGLRAQPGVGIEEVVVRAFVHQECLLLLDNCEHVLDAASALAQAVTARSAGVSVLATSREGLGVPGEQLLAVRPLSVDHAVELFRARVSEHQNAVPAANDPLVTELCERLDGLPLAIELAAARSRSMSLVDLTGRLDERFRLLRGQRRSADRHQTLRALVAWSYGLLTEPEKRLFDRLSVFTGGFTLAAADVVCTGEDFGDAEVDELVVSLADKSMLVPEPGGRYRLLETLRQFGEERLQDTGDPDRFRDAHLTFFAGLVVECHDGLQGREQPDWLRRLFADWPNVRAAFGWARATGRVSAAARIATHLVWPSQWHDMSEPFAWVQEVARMPGADTDSQWHHVLAALAMATWEANRLDDAVAIGLRALEAEPVDDPNLDLMAEFAIASGAAFTGQFELAERYVTRGVERAQTARLPYFEAYHLVGTAIVLGMGGSNDRAAQASRRGREIATDVGNPALLAWALAIEGIRLRNRDHPDAGAVLERGLEIARGSHATIAAWTCRLHVAQVLLEQGRSTEAIALIVEDLRLMRRRVLWLHRTLLEAAVALTVVGDPTTAATLYGAIDRASLVSDLTYKRLIERVEDGCVGVLGAGGFDDLAAAGGRLEPEQAALLAEDTLVAISD